jgi:uncharacterized membrane protein (Fun14 family)
MTIGPRGLGSFRRVGVSEIEKQAYTKLRSRQKVSRFTWFPTVVVGASYEGQAFAFGYLYPY